MRTQVAILGAGPAGLSLARMLTLQGIESQVIELRSEEHVRARLRAGVIEQTTVDLLTELGAADRLHREALRHNGFYLRFDGRTHRLDFAAETGRHAYVYGQNRLVADLVDLRTADADPIHFDCSEVSLDGVDGPQPRVRFRRDGAEQVIACDFIAGADGFHGVSRTLIPASATATRTYPAAWLGILARTSPVTEEGMYCASPRGLSVHSMRGRDLTRQYLQAPAGTDLAEWPDERIWQELELRSAAVDAPELETGEIIERSLAPLRSVVTEQMQRGSLFLLGDAAHIVPPTAAHLNPAPTAHPALELV